MLIVHPTPPPSRASSCRGQIFSNLQRRLLAVMATTPKPRDSYSQANIWRNWIFNVSAGSLIGTNATRLERAISLASADFAN
jgi:hypothetical protein